MPSLTMRKFSLSCSPLPQSVKSTSTPALRLPPEQGGQPFQGLRPLQPAGGQQGPQGKEHLILLPGGEEAAVQHELIHQADAAPLSPLGIDRHTGGGKGVHVPVDGPLRHLEALRQLPGGEGAALHQQIEQLKQAAVFHPAPSHHRYAAQDLPDGASDHQVGVGVVGGGGLVDEHQAVPPVVVHQAGGGVHRQ